VPGTQHQGRSRAPRYLAFIARILLNVRIPARRSCLRRPARFLDLGESASSADVGHLIPRATTEEFRRRRNLGDGRFSRVIQVHERHRGQLAQQRLDRIEAERALKSKHRAESGLHLPVFKGRDRSGRQPREVGKAAHRVTRRATKRL
jgi:hypothetical protein